MKYDEKTGKPTPENRQDEIAVSLSQLNEIRKKTGGFNDKQAEMCKLLSDMDVSLGMITDVCILMLHLLEKLSGGIEEDGETEDDKRTTEST